MAEEIKYEDIAKRMQGNLEQHEAFYFASLMRSGEHGKEGQRDGLYASLWGLREKVGLEGILGILEAQAQQSIEGNNGLNAEYSLSTVIENTSRVFIDSLMILKPTDVIPYISERGISVENRSNKQLKDLFGKEASKEDKEYGEYLLAQVQNAVIAKMVPLAYKERAKRINEDYLAKHPKEKKK